MSHELTIAYSRVKKQWPGLIVRQHQPRIKGWPDFILLNGKVTFAEVKWLEDARIMPILQPMQRHWLNLLHANGAGAVLLVAHPESWSCWRAPFLRAFAGKRGRDHTYIPFAPWWTGDHLEGLSIKILEPEDRP